MLGAAQSLSTVADQNQETCNDSNVSEIQRPLGTHKKLSSTFPYRFRYLKKSNPDAATVIFLPGGPGETSIISIPELTPKFPETLSVIRTDPRGVGCNDTLGSVDPHEVFSTDYLAEDVLAIISHLKLTHYVLYGQSYGTQLATVVAAKAGLAGLPIPKAVVLEATVGRALTADEHFKDGFLAQWEEIKPHLPPSVIELINEKTPLEYTSEEWGTFIAMMLMAGNKPEKGNSLERWLLSATEPTARGHFYNFFKKMVEKASDQQIELYRSLVCRELTTDVSAPLIDVRFLLIKGDLIADDKSICNGLSVDRPYDSADWLIQSPIFYFQGDKDPDAIPGHAKYHFDHQGGVKRYFVSVPQGSHTALSFNLRDCSEEIWKELTGDSLPDLDPALKKCALKSRLTIEGKRFVRQ